MNEYDARFWSETERHQPLAKEYEQGISITHPTGHFECRIDGFTGHCPFCATSVKRYEYQGSKQVFG